MYDISRLYEPKTIEDALRLMADHPEARVLAGGSDLLIKLREGGLAGIECISIHKIEALRGVERETDGTVLIRPLTSFSHVEASPVVQTHIPVLGEAVGTVGGPQIRNIGTIGGNICNGVTSADSASTLFALDAVLSVQSAIETRTLPIEQFYLGPGRVDLRPGELLTAIRIGRESYEGYYGKYIKFAMRNAMDIATLGCSVNVKLSPDKQTLEDVRLAFGVAAPTPMRCRAAEEAVCKKALTSELMQALSETALGEITPRTSWRATKELRMQIAGETARRAFKEAVTRAGGIL